MSNMCDQRAISISYTAQAAALPSFNGGSSIVTNTTSGVLVDSHGSGIDLSVEDRHGQTCPW